MTLLGIKALRTTSYHPQCNGLVERAHRVLKERIMASGAPAHDWMATLPFVLLSIRTSLRADADFSPAEIVYGTQPRLPGVCSWSSSTASANFPDMSSFVTDLRQLLPLCAPPEPAHHAVSPSHVPSALLTCSRVLVPVDSVRRPLTQPFSGPFNVLRRSAKVFVLDRSGKEWTVSIDRLKPYFDSDKAPLSINKHLHTRPPAGQFPSQGSRDRSPSFPCTRSGRSSRPPDRLVL